MTKIVKIALIPGDGIGKEVMPEGVRVLEAAASKHGLNLEWTEFDWSCETYLETGQMMPEDGIDQLRPFDAVYLGAVGFPSIPDHISLWGLLIPIRREFDQYVNLRPVRLFEGVPCPLANKKPGDIDFYVGFFRNVKTYSGDRIKRVGIILMKCKYFWQQSFCFIAEHITHIKSD